MANNAQKTHLARELNQFAAKKALDAIQKLGKALPASIVAVSGSIVTVKFELNSPFTLPQVTMPILGSQWARVPTQVGDKGVVQPADAYLGGMSGLGGGIADLTLPGNLSALVWMPVGNTDWDTVDPNQYVIYGPNGAVIRDSNSNTTVTVDGQGNAVIHGLKSVSTDINGYGSRTTFNGGSSFTVDNYTTGATVTTNTHAWSPPALPAP